MGGDADAGIWRLGSTSSCVTEAYCTGKVHSLGGVAQMAVFGAASVGLGTVGVGVMGAIPNSVGIGFRYDSVPMSPAMVGTSQWYQVIFRDVNALDGTYIGMTNGMRLTFCP